MSTPAPHPPEAASSRPEFDSTAFTVALGCLAAEAGSVLESRTDRVACLDRWTKIAQIYGKHLPTYRDLHETSVCGMLMVPFAAGFLRAGAGEHLIDRAFVHDCILEYFEILEKHLRAAEPYDMLGDLAYLIVRDALECESDEDVGLIDDDDFLS
jgi:hypothetical protein